MKIPFLILCPAIMGLMCSCNFSQNSALLEDFKTINNSLKTSISIADNSKASLDKSFAKQYGYNRLKFEKSFRSYEDLNTVADKTCNYIEEIKHSIIKGVDGADADTLSTDGLGDSNIPTVFWKQIILLSSESKPGQLQKAVEKFRDVAIKVCNDNRIGQYTIDDLNSTFKMEEEKSLIGSRTWEARIFDNVPAIACLTMLTKIESDIRNTQVEIGKELLGSADQEDVRVNKMTALVLSDNSCPIVGGKYESRIVLAALDTTKSYDIYVGGNKLGPDGKYTVACGSVGSKSYTGYISVKQKDGIERRYGFRGEYFVREPSVSISTNALYAGVPNDISVSCPGVDNSNLSISFTNASVQKSLNGVYTVIPRNPGSKCVVSVTARIDGRSQNMGAKTFKILNLPTAKK